MASLHNEKVVIIMFEIQFIQNLRSEMHVGIRILIVVLASVMFGCAHISPTMSANYDYSTGMYVIITGTGKGPFTIDGGAGVLVVVNGKLLQFDSGPKTKAHLDELGILKDHKIDYLFYTHLHADHTTDFVDMYAWAQWVFSADLKIFGPKYTTEMTEAARSFLYASLADERAIREKFEIGGDDGNTDPRGFELQEIIGAGGIVLDDGDIRVTAVKTPHAVAEDTGSYAYRVDSAYGSVVISGDTAPSLDVVELSANTDVLVHEVSHPEPEMSPELYSVVRHVKLGDNLEDYRKDPPLVHSTPREVGRVAAMANVKTLVTYHTTYGYEGSLRSEFIEAIKENFFGELIVGKPLLVIPIQPEKD